MAEGYQVIARRWRPQQFDEIVGQEHIVRTLKNAIETNRIGHAYLFVGPRGTGKTTTARIFAKALNCVGGPKVSPPPDDPNCKAIIAGACMDVIEIDAATNRSVEDARTIRDECQYAPAQCKFKIFIIDEVHQLSKDAFNALLKTLEEPPPHIKFIFATTEAEKVLATVTSRCQRFEFQPIPERQIVERLELIAKADGIEATPDALLTIARLAKGGMRDSQSILDQAISFCGKTITARDVANIYGIASIEEINALFTAMTAADYAGVVAMTDRFFADGRDLVRVHQDIQARVRNALRATIQNPAAPAFADGAAVPPLTTEQYLRMLETLQNGETALKEGLSERANFEVTLLKAVEQSRSRAIETLIKQVATLAAGLPPESGEKKINPSPDAAAAADNANANAPAADNATSATANATATASTDAATAADVARTDTASAARNTGEPPVPLSAAAATITQSILRELPPLPSLPPPPPPSPLAIPRPADAPRTSTWSIPTAPRSPLLNAAPDTGNAHPARPRNGAPRGDDSAAANFTDNHSAFDDSPPLESILGADAADFSSSAFDAAGASDFASNPYAAASDFAPNASARARAGAAAAPPAHAGDPDFDAALAAAPAVLKTFLSETYRVQFTVLLPAPVAPAPRKTVVPAPTDPLAFLPPPAFTPHPDTDDSLSD